MSSTSPLDNPPALIHHITLHSPSLNTRSWSSRPHPNANTPLLATATSDKSIHIWDMRDWKLLSTIAGGHKRSIRCVGWKDYGAPAAKKRKAVQQTSEEEPDSSSNRDPVVLATGSFDANCGLWVWNQDRNQSGMKSADKSQSQAVPGSFGDDEDMEQEQDFTNQNQAEDADDEEWQFSTLLTGPDSEIKDLQFSPPHYGANLLATCSRDKSVWVWEEVEPEEWETVAVLGEHTGDVKCVTWLDGARTTRGALRKRLKQCSDVNNREEGISTSAGDIGTNENGQDEDEEEVILGGRELLASGSYDDTIRLHHDDEAEGDWITIAVLTGHEGTVWDLKFEPYINLAAYPPDTTEEEVVVDWAPRLISCSDDLTIRVWKKVLSEKERQEKSIRVAEAQQGRATSGSNANGQAVPVQTGFMSNRLPSVIRPPTSTEKWAEDASLPATHVRSVYAVDWSAKTGLIVSCGGDGVIAVYKEFAVPQSATTTVPKGEAVEDTVMNGTAENEQQSQIEEEEGVIKKLTTEWKVVALIEAAHDEYEINHVCWAPVRDRRRQLDAGEVVDGSDQDDEEYIVSTGDDGDVRVWRLPKEVLEQIRQES